jgi:hypothetical protein
MERAFRQTDLLRQSENDVDGFSSFKEVMTARQLFEIALIGAPQIKAGQKLKGLFAADDTLAMTVLGQR